MASLKLYFDTRSPRKDGSCPIKIAVNHKGSFLVNLKIYMTPDEFTQQTVIRDNFEVTAYPPGRKLDASYINQRMLQAKAKLLNLSVSGRLPHLSSAELKREIEGSPLPDTEEDRPCHQMGDRRGERNVNFRQIPAQPYCLHRK